MPANLSEFAAAAEYTVNGAASFLLIKEDPSRTVESRYEYDEQDVVSGCTVSNDEKYITQTAAIQYSFIERVVTLNKKLLQRCVDRSWSANIK